MEPSRTGNRWSLVTTILRTFQPAMYPGDERIVRDPPEQDWDAAEALRRLVGKTWEHLGIEMLEAPPDAMLYHYHDVPGLLTPVAFAYYLPAFMLVSLDISRADVIVDTTLYCLARDPFPSLNDQSRLRGAVWFDEMRSLLAPEQRACVRMFLRYVREADPDSVDAVPGLWTLWTDSEAP